jgi:hypothetical protein
VRLGSNRQRSECSRIPYLSLFTVISPSPRRLMLLFLRLLLLCGLVIAQQDLTLYQRASLFVKHSLQLNSARQLSASLRTAFKSLARRQQQPLHSGAQCRLKQPAIGLTDDHGQATSPTTASSTRSARPSAQRAFNHLHYSKIS